MIRMSRLAQFGFVLLLGGCSYFVSWENSSRSWIGKPIEEFIELNGSATAVRRINSSAYEYKFDLPKVGPGCIQYWLVNDSGIIFDFHYEGKCRVIG